MISRVVPNARACSSCNFCLCSRPAYRKWTTWCESQLKNVVQVAAQPILSDAVVSASLQQRTFIMCLPHVITGSCGIIYRSLHIIQQCYQSFPIGSLCGIKCFMSGHAQSFLFNREILFLKATLEVSTITISGHRCDHGTYHEPSG